MTDAQSVLAVACHRVGLDAAGAEVIRAGENTLYRVSPGIVARVTRRGQGAAATKEIQVSRWLQEAGVPVVETLPDVCQPVLVDDRAVTFWRELPRHTHGSIEQVADILRQIHVLPVPEGSLPSLAPFVRIAERIAEAELFNSDEKQWLLRHLQTLISRYDDLPSGMPHSAIHGDAWGGNIVATATGPVVLDLERFASGPPEWDLTSIAVDRFTFGTMPASEWTRFCERYGRNVTTWEGYPVLRDARELRKVTFAAQMAATRPRLVEQAHYRLACIRGERGPRPWNWTPVP